MYMFLAIIAEIYVYIQTVSLSDVRCTVPAFVFVSRSFPLILHHIQADGSTFYLVLVDVLVLYACSLYQ